MERERGKNNTLYLSAILKTGKFLLGKTCSNENEEGSKQPLPSSSKWCILEALVHREMQ